jgi:hypothetical protein
MGQKSTSKKRKKKAIPKKGSNKQSQSGKRIKKAIPKKKIKKNPEKKGQKQTSNKLIIELIFGNLSVIDIKKLKNIKNHLFQKNYNSRNEKISIIFRFYIGKYDFKSEDPEQERGDDDKG